MAKRRPPRRRYYPGDALTPCKPSKNSATKPFSWARWTPSRSRRPGRSSPQPGSGCAVNTAAPSMGSASPARRTPPRPRPRGRCWTSTARRSCCTARIGNRCGRCADLGTDDLFGRLLQGVRVLMRAMLALQDLRGGAAGARQGRRLQASRPGPPGDGIGRNRRLRHRPRRRAAYRGRPQRGMPAGLLRAWCWSSRPAPWPFIAYHGTPYAFRRA